MDSGKELRNVIYICLKCLFLLIGVATTSYPVLATSFWCHGDVTEPRLNDFLCEFCQVQVTADTILMLRIHLQTK